MNFGSATQYPHMYPHLTTLSPQGYPFQYLSPNMKYINKPGSLIRSDGQRYFRFSKKKYINKKIKKSKKKSKKKN